MREVTLLLGSNSGDRERNIRSALNLLDIAMGKPRTAMTDIIETKACGFDGNDFLNCAVRYPSMRKPETILAMCKTIERQLGRNDAPEYDADGNRVYHNRIIDIDILLYGNVRMKTGSLTIPHPQIESRSFVRELLTQF